MLNYRNLKNALAILGSKIFTAFCTDSVFAPKPFYVFSDTCLSQQVLIPSNVEFSLPGQEIEFIGSFLKVFKEEVHVTCSKRALQDAIEGTYYPDDSHPDQASKVEEGIWTVRRSTSGQRNKDNSEYMTVYTTQAGFRRIATMTPKERLYLFGWRCFNTFSSWESYSWDCDCEICEKERQEDDDAYMERMNDKICSDD